MAKQVRVLLVEDSRTQALRIQLELMRHGLSVEIANTGSEGFKLARARPPDVIVLDVELPEMDGFSLCRKLKADPRTARVPVFMLTHLVEDDDEQMGAQVGADEYIAKDGVAERNLILTLRRRGLI